MTTREWNLVKEAVARTRYELENRVAAPGPQDAWRNDFHGEGVKRSEATEIRDYIRAGLQGNIGEMRRIGRAA